MRSMCPVPVAVTLVLITLAPKTGGRVVEMQVRKKESPVGGGSYGW